MKRKILLFLLICFVISYSAGFVFYLCGGKLSSIAGSIFAMVYMLIPTISVILTQLICHDKLFSGLGLHFKINLWWFVAWFSMPIFCLATLFVSTFFQGVEFSTETQSITQTIAEFAKGGMVVDATGIMIITIVAGLFAGCTINAFFAFGEEIAWRGFLVTCMSNMKFVYKSLIIGTVWGAWHAPLILMGHNYPIHPQLGVFMMIVFCILLTPLYIFFREKSKSTIAPIIAHGTLNGSAGLAIAFVLGGNDIYCGVTGIAGMIVLFVVDVIILCFHKEKL